jgi:hypothetical protein
VIRTDHRAHLQVTFEAQEKARKISERFAEWLWEDPERTTRLVEEDFVPARCGQCVVLALGALIAGGHSAVPDAHVSDGIANGGGRGVGVDTAFFTNST